MHHRSGNCFDFPQYFELAFADETQQEADFIEAACRKYGRPRTRQLLEPGCGGGRLLIEMARRGYQLTGFDTSTRALTYLRRRLRRSGLAADVRVAEMAQFQLPQRFDAAINTFDTFRHLISEKTAASHLQCVADCLRAGGIYILGFHLLPLDVSEECTERWSAQRGRTNVHFTLRVLSADRRKRLEQIRITMRVRTARDEFRLRTEFPFRMYTASQFRRLLARVPQFQLCDVYDFWYEIDHPLQLNDEIADTVFVLRRR